MLLGLATDNVEFALSRLPEQAQKCMLDGSTQPVAAVHAATGAAGSRLKCSIDHDVHAEEALLLERDRRFVHHVHHDTDH